LKQPKTITPARPLAWRVLLNANVYLRLRERLLLRLADPLRERLEVALRRLACAIMFTPFQV
jgi:hypothetical protein